NRPFADHFKWRPEEGTRLVVLDRDGGAREHETDPFFTFHTVHAFETKDATVLDLLAYPDAGIVEALMVENMLERPLRFLSKLTRFSIDRASGKVRKEPLTDAHFEFPQVDWELAHNRSPTRVFGASGTREGRGEVVAVDLPSGKVHTFRE